MKKYSVTFFENEVFVGELLKKFETVQDARDGIEIDYAIFQIDGTYMIEDENRVIEMYSVEDGVISDYKRK